MIGEPDIGRRPAVADAVGLDRTGGRGGGGRTRHRVTERAAADRGHGKSAVVCRLAGAAHEHALPHDEPRGRRERGRGRRPAVGDARNRQRGAHGGKRSAAGRHPGHRQVVTPAALLHQGLDVITLPGDQADRRRLLARVGGPSAVIGPDVHVGDLRRVVGAGIRRQPQLAVVVAGDPEHVRAGGGRINVALHALAVVGDSRGVGGLERSQVRCGGGGIRIVRVEGRIGQIVDRVAAVEVVPHLVQNLARRRLVGHRQRECSPAIDRPRPWPGRSW